MLANLGNFVLRGLSFIFKFFDAKIPAVELTSIEEEFIKAVNVGYALFLNDLENVKLREALTKVLAVSRLGNQYMQANKPWELFKGSDEDKLVQFNIIRTIYFIFISFWILELN